jgi:hypothetical protein
MRWLGFSVDPTAGGTTYDDINDGTAPVAFPVDPTTYVPVTTGTVSPGSNNLNRDNVVFGRRANTAPEVLNEDPTFSFEAPAFVPLTKQLIATALSGAPVNTGTAPAAIVSTIEPVQVDPLKMLYLTYLREEQIDFVAGGVIYSLDINLAANAYGALTVNGRGLYHDHDESARVTVPTADFAPYAGAPTYMLRDLTALLGDGAGVRVDCLSSFTMTFDNGFDDTFEKRFCAGENIRTFVVGGKQYRVWFPGRHKVGPQAITGNLTFGVPRPDLELDRILSVAQKLVVTVDGGPITPATTPPANELMEITLARSTLTGGDGAEALVRAGSPGATYTYGGYLDPATRRDISVRFTGRTAVTV